MHAWMMLIAALLAGPARDCPQLPLAPAVTGDPLGWVALLTTPDERQPETSSGAPPAVESSTGPAAETEASDAPGSVPDPLPAAAEATVPENGASKGAEPALPVSAAEQISRLERHIADDERHLAQLKAELAGPEKDRAHAEFRELDRQLEQLKAALEAAGSELPEAERAAQQRTIDEVSKKRQLAAERFDLILQSHETLAEQVAIRTEKIVRDRQTLRKLLGEETADEPPPTATARRVEGSTEPGVSPPGAAPPSSQSPQHPADPAAPPANSLPVSPLAGAVLQGLAGGTTDPASGASEAATVAPIRPESPTIAEARADAELKEAAAVAAEQAAAELARRAEMVRREIEQVRKLLDNARKRADNADQTVRALEGEFQAQLLAGGDPQALRARLDEIAKHTGLSRQVRAEGRERAIDLDRLQSQLAELQTGEIAALHEADAKRKAADQARRRLEWLGNPFSPQNLLGWMIHHGLTIVAILLAMAGFIWGARHLQERIVGLVTSRSNRGTREDHENRARTLVGVVRYAMNLAIVTGGTLMILDEIGISIAPLMGGAAVLGLAVAFGAQTLIKDYFTGFMILLEQQYMVNDVIQVAGVQGQVERITLRVTVLRDLEGRVHFVPHGEITSTTNMTHGWSRAVFDIGVGYGEDVDRVIAVLEDLADELRNDPEYGPLILEPATMLGVDQFGESAIVIRFFLKTRPLRQWPVKRELLRRIKKRFDELGIEIPYPSRTLHMRVAGSGASAETMFLDASGSDEPGASGGSAMVA